MAVLRVSEGSAWLAFALYTGFLTEVVQVRSETYRFRRVGAEA